jgi:hypothetical protein
MIQELEVAKDRMHHPKRQVLPLLCVIKTLKSLRGTELDALCDFRAHGSLTLAMAKVRLLGSSWLKSLLVHTVLAWLPRSLSTQSGHR